MIGGFLGGRKLAVPLGRLVRPTAERAREALFDLLGEGVQGATFLDGYAGTGAVGIEAFSRGADRSSFIEADERAGDVLRRNLAIDASLAARSRLIVADLAEALSTLEQENVRFRIVFLDPPYGGELARGLRLVGESELLAPGGIVIGEHESGETPPEIRSLVVRRTATYGRTALTIYERARE